jgi:hypothetical protein
MTQRMRPSYLYPHTVPYFLVHCCTVRWRRGSAMAGSTPPLSSGDGTLQVDPFCIFFQPCY